MSSSPPKNFDYSEFLKDDAWESEKAVIKALENLGHEVTCLGVFDDVHQLIADLKYLKPDLVFNMTEAYKKRRDFEPHIPSLLELLEIPYTGARPLGLSLCQ